MSSTYARRYAQALLEIAESQKDAQEFSQQLRELFEQLKGSSELFNVLNDPVIKQKLKKNLLISILDRIDKDMNLKKPIRNTFMLLLDNKKFTVEFLDEFIREFIVMCDKNANILHAKIITAVELEQSQLEGIVIRLIERYQARDVKYTVKINASLIGGIRVEIEDQILDYSLDGRLQNLREMLRVGR